MSDFFETTDFDSTAPDAIMAVYRDAHIAVDEIAVVVFADWWARHAPRDAFGARGVVARRLRPVWVRAVVREWARVDSPAALEAVRALPERPLAGRREGLEALVASVFEGSTSVDPTPVFEFVVSLADVRERGETIQLFLAHLIEQRVPVEAQDFIVAATLPDLYGASSEVYGRFASLLLKRDPALAIDFANRYAGGRFGSGLVLHLAAEWGWEDGPAAMAWAMSLPEEHHRERAVARAARSFLSTGEAAQVWMEQQAPSVALEPGYAFWLRGLAKRDPAAAIERSSAIDDSSLRDEVLIMAGRTWIERDEFAARAWMQASNLSSEVQAKIVNRAWVNSRPGKGARHGRHGDRVLARPAGQFRQESPHAVLDESS